MMQQFFGVFFFVLLTNDVNSVIVFWAICYFIFREQQEKLQGVKLYVLTETLKQTRNKNAVHLFHLLLYPENDLCTQSVNRFCRKYQGKLLFPRGWFIHEPNQTQRYGLARFSLGRSLHIWIEVTFAYNSPLIPPVSSLL